MSGDGMAHALWALWTSTEVPLLPRIVVAQVYLHVGWCVILAWLGRRWYGWIGASMLAVWAWVPGVWGASHWLGLSFQAPSVVAVLWCAYVLGERAADNRTSASSVPTYSLIGTMLLGWVLLADVLAWLPVSFYAWGFSSAALGVLLVLALVPLALPSLRHVPGAHSNAGWLLWPLALAVFVAMRLPSGNVWDAVIDPWLWLAAHIVSFKRWQVYRARRTVSRSESLARNVLR